MKKGRSFLDTFLPSLKCLLYFLVFYLAAVLVNAIIGAVASLFGKALPSSLTGIVAYAFVFLVFTVGFVPFKTTVFKEAQINKPKISLIIDGALLGMGFFGAYQGVASLISKIPAEWIQKLFETQSDMASTQLEGQMVFAILYLGIVAPICEELVFRGLMLTSLENYLPKWVSILVCALCFGIIHYPSPIAMVVTFVLGALLGFVFYRTKSLIPCILAHMLFNLSNFLLFIPKNIGFYILVIACIPLIVYSLIDIVRKTRG